MNLIVTNHAYEQYISRVGEINRDELTQILSEQIQEPHRHKGDLVHLDGVWWAYRDGCLITCYGKTEMDLPKALGWAADQKDRINLEHLV